MTRRAHRRSSPLLWLSVPVGFLLLGGIGTFVLQKDKDPYRTVEHLNPSDYFENANSLQGNVYQLEGVIVSSLGGTPSVGRLFGFRARQGQKESPLPILVPPNYREINLQKGQRYRLKVRVNDAGLLLVEEMTKA